MKTEIIDHCFGCGAQASPERFGMCDHCFTRWWQTTNDAQDWLRASRLVLGRARAKANVPS